MSNHLIIGLGGTGGKVLRALRKLIYQRHVAHSPEGFNVGYLFVDSDPSMMEQDTEVWRVMGHNVGLPNSSKLPIDGAMRLGGVLDNLNDYPGIRPWIGDRSQWRDLLVGANAADVAAGQKRRMGRFLLSNRVSTVLGAFQQEATRLQTGGSASITVHVCCGLAGGTGSGTIVDTVSQLRKLLGDSGAADGKVKRTILIYALLPEQNPNPSWLTGASFYQANGYAALRELNALAVGEWKPHDISGQSIENTGGYHQAASRLNIQDPFNGCYVFSNVNAAGYQVDVAAELPRMAASFLYHKVFTLGQIRPDTLLSRQERFEMGGGAAGAHMEQDYVGGPPTRASRFLTFGVKQIAYPEVEIREYLTFTFAAQAALQLRYNNWVETIGFADERSAQSLDPYLRDTARQEAWNLEDKHLMLAQPVLPGEGDRPRWRMLSDEWQTMGAYLHDTVKEHVEKDRWLTALTERFSTHFEEGFREEGVASFYHHRRGNRTTYAKHIAGLIERDLFEVWLSGEQSMAGVIEILGAIAANLGERKEKYLAQKSSQSQIAQGFLDQAKTNDAEWAKMGQLMRLTRKPEQLLKAKASNLENYYLAQTREAAYGFAATLAGALADDLLLLRGDVSKAASMLGQSVDRFREGIAARLNDGAMTEEERRKEQVIRFYDAEEVERVTTHLRHRRAAATRPCCSGTPADRSPRRAY
ncbi:MAG: tubulin-like doman-containing protein [Bacteroidota bacterium]